MTLAAPLSARVRYFGREYPAQIMDVSTTRLLARFSTRRRTVEVWLHAPSDTPRPTSYVALDAEGLDRAARLRFQLSSSALLAATWPQLAITDALDVAIADAYDAHSEHGPIALRVDCRNRRGL